LASRPYKFATKLLEDKKPKNDGAVCGKQDSVLAHVQEQLAEGNISEEQADLKSDFAQAIKENLNCT
tara:strand:- start:840 stop:1040 length:201 start_codon:yes stop_codon:yes gene_type:complete